MRFSGEHSYALPLILYLFLQTTNYLLSAISYIVPAA